MDYLPKLSAGVTRSVFEASRPAGIFPSQIPLKRCSHLPIPKRGFGYATPPLEHEICINYKCTEHCEWGCCGWACTDYISS